VNPRESAGPGDAPSRLEVLLDAFLAGELDASSTHEFETLVKSDPHLRARVDLQERIARSLRDTHAAPRAVAQSGAPRAFPMKRLAWYGIAAAVLLVGAQSFNSYMKQLVPDRTATPESIYRRLVSLGFKPAIPCPNDPVSFSNLVKARLGSGLLATIDPGSEIELLGWGYKDDYGTPLSNSTMILLVDVQKKHVVLYIDRIGNDATLPDPKSGLKMFRKPVGNLVLYEVTPLEDPRVLPHLSEPK